MANRILEAVFHRACNTCQTTGPIELQLTNRFPLCLSHFIRRPLACLAGLTLLLFGHSMEARSGGCQSYEAAFNLEAGMRDGLTQKQAKASILDDGYTDGSAACFAAIKNEINQMPYAFPLVSSSLQKNAPLESTHK